MLQTSSLPHTPAPHTPASPPHNPYPHVPPLKPCKSPPPSPRHMQAVTSTSPLYHAQVCWHHPVTVCKTHHNTASTPSQHGMQARLQRQPALRKPCHAPPQCSMQVPPCQPVAHEPCRDATHHGAMQKPHHQLTTTPPCAASLPLLTSYSSTS